MKWIIKLRCPHCNKLINETKPLSDYETVKKLEFDALINPMIGWCTDCDSKPLPIIKELSS